MIVYFYWNELILNIRFYFQYFFLIRKFIFAAISYFLRNCIPKSVWFGPCLFWVLKCWRMPNAPWFPLIFLLLLHSDSIHCYKRLTIKYTIHNDEVNEWKTYEWNTFTYIVIITHNNISTGDLYTGNIWKIYIYKRNGKCRDLLLYYFFFHK